LQRVHQGAALLHEEPATAAVRSVQARAHGGPCTHARPDAASAPAEAADAGREGVRRREVRIVHFGGLRSCFGFDAC